MYRLKQNCNFQTETSFCASKSPKFRCIFSCEAVFLSYKHNNDRDNEQTLIQEQITEKMSRLCWTTLRPRPLLNSTSSSQSPANNVFLVFCSVVVWQTTTLEGL